MGFLRREELLRTPGWQEVDGGILEVTELEMGDCGDSGGLLYVPVTDFGLEDLMSSAGELAFTLCIKPTEKNS